jgi:WD40 repeat protein
MCRHFSLMAVLLIPQLLAAQEPKLDAYGDPLPAGSLARLGTVRWRNGEGSKFAAFLPDGKTLLDVGGDGTAREREVASGKELRKFGPFPTRGPVALSGNGKVIAASDFDKVQLWDVAAGKELRKIRVDGWLVTALAVTSDGKTLAACDGRRALRLYEVSSGNALASLMYKTNGNDTISAYLDFSPDGKRLAATTHVSYQDVAELTVWDTEAGKELYRHTRKERNNFLGAVKFSPDGKWLAWIWMNGPDRIVLADAATGKEMRRLEYGSQHLDGFVFAQDSKTLIAKERFGKGLFISEVATGKRLRNLEQSWLEDAKLGIDAPGLMALSPDGKLLAVAGPTGPISIVDVATGTNLHRNDSPRVPIIRIRFARDGKQVFTTDEAGGIRFWDPLTGKPLRTIPAPQIRPAPEPSTQRLLSDDGQLLLSIAGSIRLQEMATGRQLPAIASDLKFPTAPAISPDNTLLAVTGIANKKGVIVLYEITTGKEHRRLALPELKFPYVERIADDMAEWLLIPRSILFAPDGRTLAARRQDGKVVLWSLTTGRQLPTIRTSREDEIRSMAFSPDGRSLALDRDGTACLYETATGMVRRYYGAKPESEGPAQDGVSQSPYALPRWYFIKTLETLAFSPDGRILAHSREGGTITLWDVEAGRKELGRLSGHQADTLTLAFSPDGKKLASGSKDTTALLWDVSSFSAKSRPHAVTIGAAGRWQDLESENAVSAFNAVCALAAVPDKAVPYLKEHLRPAVAVDAATVNRLIAGLDSEQFEVRKKANEELAKLGEAAVPLIRKALEAGPSAEARKRLEALLANEMQRVPTGETLRSLRAIEVLEMIGTTEAKSVLEGLAKGAPGATVTRAAKESLQRMKR